METVDVADGIVEVRVEAYCIWATVGQSKKGVTGCVGDCRTKAAEQVGRRTIFETVVEAGEIGEGSGTGLIESAGSEQVDLGLGVLRRE